MTKCSGHPIESLVLMHGMVSPTIALRWSEHNSMQWAVCASAVMPTVVRPVSQVDIKGARQAAHRIPCAVHPTERAIAPKLPK